MTKYEELRNQVLGELKFTIDMINRKHPERQIPQDIRLMDILILEEYKYIEPEDRGILFAYLGIKSKIDYLEDEYLEDEEEET